MKTNNGTFEKSADLLAHSILQLYSKTVPGPATYYPKGVYPKPENTANEKWLTSVNENLIYQARGKAKEIQSINPMNSFYSMEIIVFSISFFPDTAADWL